MKRVPTVLAAVFFAAATSLDCGGGSGLHTGGASGSDGGASGSSGHGGASGSAGGAGASDSGGGAGTSGSGGNASAGAGGSVTSPPDASVDAPDSVPTSDARCPSNAFAHDGRCVCEASTPTLCTTACVDLATDPDHCGACNHACAPTSACVAGVCGPAPVTLVAPTSSACGPIDLALANGKLYWTEKTAGNVKSVDLATGAVATLASAEKAPSRIQVRADAVYWLWMNQTIRAYPASPQSLVAFDAFNSPTSLDSYVASPDGARLYLASSTGIDELTLGSGRTPLRVVSWSFGMPRFPALAMSGTQLAASADIYGFIEVMDLLAGTPAICEARDASGSNASVNCARVAQSLGGLLPDVLLLVPGHAIWANYSSLEFSGSTTAYSKLSIANVDANISGIAVAGDWATFATRSDTNPDTAVGVVYKVPFREEQVAVPLARGQLTPRSLATDGKRVYWSTGDCALRAADLSDEAPG